MLNNESVPLLIVEDSDEDFEILIMTFQKYQISNPVIRCTQGEEVLLFLNDLVSRGQSLPGLILLDLNLIGLDGREVLRQLKDDTTLRKIPVVVLSTSSSPKDVDTCYLYGANSFTVKPVNLEHFERFVKLLKEYWLETAILPRTSSLEFGRKVYVKKTN